jgi:hypothetical protein
MINFISKQHDGTTPNSKHFMARTISDKDLVDSIDLHKPHVFLHPLHLTGAIIDLRERTREKWSFLNQSSYYSKINLSRDMVYTCTAGFILEKPGAALSTECTCSQ